MGKLVIAIFFVVAVSIYWLIRYANIGISAARAHVQGQEIAATMPLVIPTREFESTEKIGGLVLQALAIQQGFMGGKRDTARALDLWSCGYIFGFCRALHHQIGMRNDGECLNNCIVTMQVIFGPERGSAMTKAYLDHEFDPQAIAGRSAGEQDAAAVYRAPDKPPLGWARYVAQWNDPPQERPTAPAITEPTAAKQMSRHELNAAIAAMERRAAEKKF